MIIGFDHFQITVPREAEMQAKAFYCDFMGLKEIEKPENRKKNGGFWLQVGKQELHIGIEDGAERLKTKAHVAYQVQNLETWRTRIQQKGLETIDSQPFPAAKAFEFRDPFGNRVEIIERL